METKIVASDTNGNPMVATVHRNGVEVGGVVFQAKKLGKYCDQGLQYWFGWYAQIGTENEARGETDTFERAIEEIEMTVRQDKR
jgi:hypothetical protein